MTVIRLARRAAMADASGAGGSLDLRHVIVQPNVSHPSSANGLHNVVRRLILEQHAAGDRGCLYLLAQDAHAMDAVPIGIPAIHLPLGRVSLAGRPMPTGRMLDRLLEGAGPHTVVHLHGAVKPAFALIAHRLRRAGVAYGVTLHGQYSHIFDVDGRVRRRLAAAYLRLVDRPGLEQARFVHAITEAEAALLRAVAPAARIRLLPNAGYSARMEGLPQPVARPAPDQSALTFGFCARFEMLHKGVDLLLDGFVAYRRGGGRGVLELIGTGNARAEIEARIASAGIADCVRMYGPKFGAEKAAIMQRWHFCVLASRFDVMPTGCVEAALSGIPLIVTRETGLAALAEESGGGIAIPALTAAAVEQALTRAGSLRPEAWREMSTGAHRMVLGIGDWGTVAARLRTLYTAP